MLAEKTASALRCLMASMVPSVHARTGPWLVKFAHEILTLISYTSGARLEKPYSADCSERISRWVCPPDSFKRTHMLVAVGHGASDGNTPTMRMASSKDMRGFDMMMHLWSYELAAAASCCATHDGGGCYCFERLFSIGSSFTNNCWNSEFSAIPIVVSYYELCLAIAIMMALDTNIQS